MQVASSTQVASDEAFQARLTFVQRPSGNGLVSLLVDLGGPLVHVLHRVLGVRKVLHLKAHAVPVGSRRECEKCQ